MAKPKTEMFDSSNIVYEFICPYDEFYVGQPKSTLSIRADEHHKNACSNICAHKLNCEIYKNDANKFLKDDKKLFTDPKKARYQHFKKI